MAPPIEKRTSEKGGAIAEALPAVVVLLIFVSGILSSAYLIFARAWLQYQSEQALYCLAEAKPQVVCRRILEKRLRAILYFGWPKEMRLSTTAKGWEVEVQWKIQNYGLKIHRQLDPQRLLRNRALHW